MSNDKLIKANLRYRREHSLALESYTREVTAIAQADMKAKVIEAVFHELDWLEEHNKRVVEEVIEKL